MSPLIDHITQLIVPVLDELDFELVRVRVTGSRTKTLQIMAERSDGTMTAKDCSKLSRAVSVLLEEDDPIEGNYNLEVSSPGIDRPLTRVKDFVRWEGFEARLELDRMVEGQKRFKGVLAGIENDHVAFDIEGEEETALFPLEWIVQAKLVMSDELVKESLKGQAAIPPDPGGAPLTEVEIADADNDSFDEDDPEQGSKPKYYH